MHPAVLHEIAAAPRQVHIVRDRALHGDSQR